MSTLHAQRLMKMQDVHRGGILNWSSGVDMHVCWRHLDGLSCEMGTCGAVGLGVPPEGTMAWTFPVKRKGENSLHPPHAWKLLPVLMLKLSFTWFGVLQQTEFGLGSLKLSNKLCRSTLVWSL